MRQPHKRFRTVLTTVRTLETTVQTVRETVRTVRATVRTVRTTLETTVQTVRATVRTVEAIVRTVQPFERFHIGAGFCFHNVILANNTTSNPLLISVSDQKALLDSDRNKLADIPLSNSRGHPLLHTG
jgi:prophage DNA circulation protein